MITIRAYAKLYAHCLVEAFRGLTRSPWTMLLPLGLGLAWIGLRTLLGPLGLIGGILAGLATNALMSCYLYFISELVTGAKARVDELQKSFGVYFFSVLNIFFVVWVVRFLLSGALAQNPHAVAIHLMVNFAFFVLLNVAPEMIYTKGTYGGSATAMASVHFIHANWIEWFIPNLLLGAAFYFGAPYLLSHLPDVAVVVLGAGALHLSMIFRGYLFAELDKSSHRQRLRKWGMPADWGT